MKHVHATFEECRLLADAIQRWDKRSADNLPKYLEHFYVKLVDLPKEFEDELEPDEKYRASYVAKWFKLLVKSYNREAEWHATGYCPTFDERLKVALESSAVAMITCISFIGMGQAATKDAFLWVNNNLEPDVVRASASAVRFIDDVVGYQKHIASTDDNFICATLDLWPPEKCDFGTCSWGLASIFNLNLSNPILLNSVKAFSPLKIRVGGSVQDQMLYDTQPCNPFVKDDSHIFGFSQGCLPFHRWDELNSFFNKSGVLVIFGLNALNGRVPQPDGSMAGPWNFSNAASLMRYTVSKDYNIYGWELGNELSGSGIGTRVNADEYSTDVINLKALVNSIYRDVPVPKPVVLAPGGFFDSNWYGILLDKTKPNLDVLTHHIYNLGPGSSDHLVDEILDPVYLEGCASVFSDTQNIIRKSGTSAVAWVGEAGGAYNSGRHLVTDAFVFSFWYLDQLGMSAKYDTKTYCRQSLIGGNYGLLNTITFEPNPDYYSALLWHKLMGRNVFSLSYTGSNMIRTYAHCAKQSKGITILLINLSGNTTTQIAITNGTNFAQNLPREEYHLTPKDGDLHSQIMLLNGKILSTDKHGNIPNLDPIIVQPNQPLSVKPFSILFVSIPSFFAPACT